MTDADGLATPERLRTFFAPRSVALVGASDGSTWSRNVLASLTRGGLPGPVSVVHPTRTSVLDLPTYANLRELPERPDLVFALVSSGALPDVLGDMAAIGAHNVIVLAAGYGEAGDEGRRHQEQLAERARECDVTLLGPNCMGFIRPPDHAAPFGTGVPSVPSAGGVGIVMQSGALGGGLLAFARAHGIGLSLLASMGNEAVVSTPDVVDYLIEDDQTRAIALFLEGITDVPRFRSSVERAAVAGKAVIALKVGRSEAGRAAALAHTGAVAGNDAVVDAALRQWGVVRVDSLEELVTTASLFAHLDRRPRGRRVAIVSASGGAADILVDRAQDEGLTLNPFGPVTTDRLRGVLPKVANPLDVTGVALGPGPAQPIERAVELVAADPDVDLVLAAVSLPTAAVGDTSTAQERLAGIGEIVHAADVPIVLCSYTCTDLTDFQREQFAQQGLLLLGGLDLAMTALGHVARWAPRRPSRLLAADTHPTERRGRPGPLNEVDAREWLIDAGVDVVPARLVHCADEAAVAAAELGGPVALKVVSAQLPHKSDVGGVVLGRTGPEAVRAGYAQIVDAVARAAPDAELDGVLVAEMRGEGVELLVSVVRDQGFGLVLTVGLGGIWVEALHDVVLRLLPVDHDEVNSMLDELRGAAVLRGGRGTQPVDRVKLVSTILGIAQGAVEAGDELEVLEINPLLVDGTRIEVLDALIVFSD